MNLRPLASPASGPAADAERGAPPTPADRVRQAVTFVLHGPGRMAWPGFFGVVLMVFGGFGSGALRRQDPLLDTVFLSWLRYGHGKILSGALVYVGLVLMFYSWVRIGRAVRAGGFTPAQLGGLAVAWAVPMLFSVPLFSRDAYSYLAQGALLRDGFDPYAVGPAVNPGPLLDNVSTVWTTTTAPYGPAFILIARGVTMITGDNVVTGTMALRLVMLPGLVLLLWAIPRMARSLGGSPAIAMWVAVLNPLVLVHLIGGVHNELLMVALLTAGIVAVLERKHLLGIAVISLAVTVKATAGAALPFMVWIWMRHRRDDDRARGTVPPHWFREFVRTAVPSVLVFAAVFATATVAAGIGVGWMTALSGANKIINWLSLPTATAQLYTVATSWFTGVGLAPALEIARLIGEAALVVIVVLIVARFRHSVHEAMHGVLYSMVAVVVLSPATLPWYYTWPLAVASGLVVSGRAMSAVAAFSVFTMIIFRPDGSIGMYQWYHVLLAAGCAAVAAVALHREDPLRLRRFLKDDGGAPDTPAPPRAAVAPRAAAGDGDG
ncbi:alpha-(1-_6)-mannopyranosyltransferase A [Tomitella gaofuii]|uniref:alpha-(1->6)-mannopyranosyltransferase A n=1 Tax=Tomitella gaofuii TaxID=2760083 RepID=UPI0015F86DF7|nr:alpha-(1->6)-mannopyranosyltransferase A [Tomitella gaofuii]